MIQVQPEEQDPRVQQDRRVPRVLPEQQEQQAKPVPPDPQDLQDLQVQLDQRVLQEQPV